MKMTNLDNELIGNIFMTNSGLQFKVLSFHHSDSNYKRYYICKFIITGYESIYISDRIKQGNIKDPFFPSLANIGYLGNIVPKDHPDEYSLWKGMIRRCYDKSHMYYYIWW